jgi:hypothetical protein
MAKGKEFAVRGATICCMRNGTKACSHTQRINLPVSHGFYVCGQPVLCEADNKYGDNIPCFGICHCKRGETEGRVTYAAQTGGGTVTGSPCTPTILAPWLNAKEDVLIWGKKALTTDSYLVCANGGFIEFLDSGQEEAAAKEKEMSHAVKKQTIYARKTDTEAEPELSKSILSDEDADEFGKDSDTYKILSDLDERWNDARESQKPEREKLQAGYTKLADDARRLAREDTPYMYGQETVMDTFRENAKTATEHQYRLLHEGTSLTMYAAAGERNYFTDSVSYLVSNSYTKWNYKEQEEWQVGKNKKEYENFNGNPMDEDNNKNWREWIYFDGEVWGADQIGNMNMAYVGMKMELPKAVFNNPKTRGQFPEIWKRDERDIKAIEKGIELAESGR